MSARFCKAAYNTRSRGSCGSVAFLPPSATSGLKRKRTATPLSINAAAAAIDDTPFHFLMSAASNLHPSDSTATNAATAATAGKVSKKKAGGKRKSKGG